MSRNEQVTIVSGLPRSGTSMMMGMLEAGGISPLTDGIRAADEDNPKGYYEFERAKKIKEDTAWLDDAKGKVVKVISQLLLSLPESHRYKIVFMQREMGEILASQRQMLIRRGTDSRDVSDEQMGPMLAKHVEQVMGWIEKHDNVECLPVNYNDVLKDAGPNIDRINQFLGGDLDTAAMTAVVDRSLYRQRK
ncbi:MAG: sulfotransferase family protein [Planctomycetota bacterium]|nr:sulfotransferase family protein [Planctomycetota bacterium]